jgi:hypothetical protein
MRITLITVLALFYLLSSASAQVKKWVDEHGVTHFEARGTGQPATRDSGTESKGEPGKAKTKIDRAHAGHTLGDNDSSYRSSAKWVLAGRDKFGASVFIGQGSAEMPSVGVMFVDQRLTMIKITYTEIALGGWNGAVKTGMDKYGKPKTDGYSEVEWSDGETVLTLKKNYRGGIEAVLADKELTQRYTSRSGQAAPKF